MGRHSKEIPADAPGRSLAEFMRQLHREAGLTWREIADGCYVTHTTLSQNADGRLTPSWSPVHAWFLEFYRAMDHHGIALHMRREEAMRQAHELWKACRNHQKALRRIQIVSAPPASPTIPIRYRQEPDARGRSATPRPNRGRVGLLQRSTVPMRPTIRMPGREGPMADVKLCTPDSLYRVTCVPDIVASLNDALIAAGFDISQLFRRGRLAPRGADEAAARELLNDQVREVLTGRYPPTPGIIQRVVKACAGTVRDREEWVAMTTPILELQPARGRASVRTKVRRPRARRGRSEAARTEPSIGRHVATDQT